MARPKRTNITRININLPDKLLKAIDTYAEERGLTRTMAITILCADQLAVFVNQSDDTEKG